MTATRCSPFGWKRRRHSPLSSPVGRRALAVRLPLPRQSVLRAAVSRPPPARNGGQERRSRWAARRRTHRRCCESRRGGKRRPVELPRSGDPHRLGRWWGGQRRRGGGAPAYRCARNSPECRRRRVARGAEPAVEIPASKGCRVTRRSLRTRGSLGTRGCPRRPPASMQRPHPHPRPPPGRQPVRWR